MKIVSLDSKSNKIGYRPLLLKKISKIINIVSFQIIINFRLDQYYSLLFTKPIGKK